MKLVYPITFKFGELGVEKLSEHDKELYLFLAKSVLSVKQVFWANDKKKELDDLFVTTPLFKKTIQETPNHISKLFIDWCQDIAKIEEKGKFKSKETVLLINIQGKGRHKQIGHLADTLQTILAGESILRIILLVNNLPQDNDIQFELLKPFVDLKSLCIIDKNGNVFQNNTKGTIDKIKYSELNKKRVPLNYELISKKIIRKIGHFKIKPHDENCNRYFYDGTYCENDLKELILDFIFREFQKNSWLEYIVYSSEFSPWLEKALSGVSADIKNDFKDELPSFKKLISVQELEKTKTIEYSNGNILLVVDFVNTGKTLANSIESIQSRFSITEIDSLKVVSVLNNLEEEKKYRLDNNRRKITVNGNDFEFTYFADVVVKSLDSKTQCDCCKLGIETTSPLEKENHNTKFKSIDFWFLADANGYKPEDNVPQVPQRDPLDLVPKFENWLIENSTYLAYKLRKFIQNYKLTNGIDFIFVFPEEKNKLQKNVAHEFALKLKELFTDVEIIGIPRDFIDDVKKGILATSQIKDVDAEWVKNIKMRTKKVDFVILDEFHNQGGTYQGIRKILNTLGNPPKSYFVLADFNPQKSSTYIDDANNFQVYSLYEFNYN